jgi:hypothetical protein
MAAIGNTTDTLINWVKTRNPDQKAAFIIELLNQSNEMIPDIQWEPGNNGPFGNRTSVQIALPTVSVRQIGEAVTMSTSREAQFDDGMSIIEGFAESDIILADASGDVGNYRLRRTRAFTEAMSQKFSQLFWYGDSTLNTKEFFGMTSRYAALSGFANSQNVLNGGGSGSTNASMWFITHGDKSLTGIFPVGTPGGMHHEDWGKQLSVQSTGYPNTVLAVYRDQYYWHAGLSLKDWRWNVRICNIDVNNLVAESGAVDLLKIMQKALMRLPSIGIPASTTGNPMTNLTNPGRTVIYTNRTIREMLGIQAQNKVSNTLTWMDVDGRKELTFQSVPIRNSDALLSTENAVS